ncbi:hypothetical protein [Nocardioides sp. SYSU D00038]|uniref:hypothetical protein n=1 Tax=Nocardioides sp. SYSU D00038 TaxID=2812554 RepID=UPI0019676FF5|nr:hypothetical protein [Nocardioides sp. SYSU D00038]
MSYEQPPASPSPTPPGESGATGATPGPTRRGIYVGSTGALVVLVLVVVGVAALGWWVVVRALGVPFLVGIPLSLVAGSAIIGWNLATTWKGYAVSALLALTGVVWFVAWLALDAI